MIELCFMIRASTKNSWNLLTALRVRIKKTVLRFTITGRETSAPLENKKGQDHETQP
jgi:hypothetical protein